MTIWYLFVISSIVVWRATYMITVENGPGDIFLRLRNYFQKRNSRSFISQLIGCFNCASIWIAFPMAIIVVVATGIAWWWIIPQTLALSAGAIIAGKVIASIGR